MDAEKMQKRPDEKVGSSFFFSIFRGLCLHAVMQSSEQ